MTTTQEPQRGERFGHYFRVSPTLDDNARREVYRIRHEVYAKDLGFEPVREEGLEFDAYDDHSVHCVVRTVQNTRPVGCVRMVLTDPEQPSRLLPFESACRDTLDRSIIDPQALPRGRIAEISRLAVMGEFRRRRGEEGRPVNLSPGDLRGEPVPRVPNIPISLCFAAVAMAQRYGIEYLFMLTEPRLSKHFAMLGVNIVPVGEAIEYRGLRVPSVMYVPAIYASLRAMIRPIWHEVHAQMDLTYLLDDLRVERDVDIPLEVLQ